MWNEIKPGQVLLTKNRVLRVGRRVAFTEWKEHIVESVTRVFYVVDSEKHRKDHCGKHHFSKFYFPGVDGAPDKATDPDEYESSMQKVKSIIDLGTIIHPCLEDMVDIDKAAELAIRLRNILDEIESQPKV